MAAIFRTPFQDGEENQERATCYLLRSLTSVPALATT